MDVSLKWCSLPRDLSPFAPRKDDDQAMPDNWRREESSSLPHHNPVESLAVFRGTMEFKDERSVEKAPDLPLVHRAGHSPPGLSGEFWSVLLVERENRRRESPVRHLWPRHSHCIRSQAIQRRRLEVPD